MRIFQASFFIVEITFYLILGLILALNPNIFLNTKKYIRKEKPKYIKLESISQRKSLVSRKVSPWKVIWFVIVMCTTVYLLKPYLLDVPQLITGKLNYVTGIVLDIRTVSKDPTDYVYLSSGDEVKFFFSSGVSRYKDYKIGYLTHTKRAIYCEQIDESNGNRKAMGFPLKDILLYLCILGAIFFLIFISAYVKFRLYIPVNIISIPIFIYFSIKYGIKQGIWFSIKNEGFFDLILSSAVLLMTLLIYFIEKRKSNELFGAYVCAQLFSVCELGLLISLVFNLD